VPRSDCDPAYPIASDLRTTRPSCPVRLKIVGGIAPPVPRHTLVVKLREDESAANFSRGFYDALSAGKSYEKAFEEGVSAVKLKGGAADKIKLLVL
jgi:hypothetical protein